MSSENGNDLFEKIYAEALSLIPSEIDCSNIEYLSGELYVIDGLYEIIDDASVNYKGPFNKIFISHVMHSIYISAHAMSKYYVRINTKDFRVSVIKEDFEEGLKFSLADDGYSWEDSDKVALRKYFG